MRNAIDNIHASLDEVKSSTVNCAWKSLWKGCVNDSKRSQNFQQQCDKLLTLDVRVGLLKP